MHVFLTGDRQVGKSRAVNGALALLGRPVYGFRTRFLTRERGSSSLYITPANDPENFSEDSMVAELRDGKMRPLSDRFDALGSALLREARLHPEGVILMDECGHLERTPWFSRMRSGPAWTEISRCWACSARIRPGISSSRSIPA